MNQVPLERLTLNNTKYLKALSWEKHEHIGVYLSLSGGARGRVIPSSIPNLEVKPPIADNTAGYVCGNVGRCHFEFFIITIFILKNQSFLYSFKCYHISFITHYSPINGLFTPH